MLGYNTSSSGSMTEKNKDLFSCLFFGGGLNVYFLFVEELQSPDLLTPRSSLQWLLSLGC